MQDRGGERGARVVMAVAAAAVLALAAGGAWVLARGPGPLQAVPATGEAPPLELPLRPVAPQPLVQAPPLHEPASRPAPARACADCGTVQRVFALQERGGGGTGAFQVLVRMDAGGEQSLELRGALAPGSRVRVRNGRLEAAPAG